MFFRPFAVCFEWAAAFLHPLSFSLCLWADEPGEDLTCWIAF